MTIIEKKASYSSVEPRVLIKVTTQNVEPLWSFYTGRGRSRELRPYWIKILRQILYCLNFCTAAPLKCLLFFWKEWIRKSVAIFCNYKTFKVVSFRTYRVKCICIFFSFSIQEKSQFWEKKICYFPFRKFHLLYTCTCTIQEYDNVTTPYYPIFSLLSVKISLTGNYKQEKISNF